MSNFFDRSLDCKTEALRKIFFEKSKKGFGAARKAMNLFLKSAYYCSYLRKKLHLVGMEQKLEIPLDNVVAKNLNEIYNHLAQKEFSIISNTKGNFKSRAEKSKIKWTSIKEMTRNEHEAFQVFAAKIAKQLGIARVHLDAYLGPAAKKYVQNRWH